MAARRRRSPVAALVVILLVVGLLAGGLVLADRYAEDRVERESAARLRPELGTAVTPSVDIQGSPFLTQLVGRRLPRVRVIADDLGADGAGSVRVAHADLVLTDVTTPDWWQTLEAAHVEGTARLDYDALTTLAGAPMTPAGDGRVRLERETSVFGADLTAVVTGTPRLDVAAQTLTLADPSISVGSVDLPEVTAEALLRTILQPVPVTGLPLDLTLTSVSAGEATVDVGLIGEDVELTR